MRIRGNYFIFFIIQIITGIMTFTLCWLYGDIGLVAVVLFFIGMALTMKTKVDEREIQLLYKSGSVVSVVIGALMTLIYFSYISLNWFHSLISFTLLARGISGLITFSRE